jgi:predicted DNA-binding transcriptional regulator AlpA
LKDYQLARNSPAGSRRRVLLFDVAILATSRGLYARSENNSVTRFLCKIGKGFRTSNTYQLTAVRRNSDHIVVSHSLGVAPNNPKSDSRFFGAIGAKPVTESLPSPFMLSPEVDAVTRMTNLTRSRLERRGKFPRRIRIGNRKIAWRKSDIEAWAADPEGWARRHAAGGRQAPAAGAIN